MVYYPYKKQIKTATRKRYGSKKKGYKYKQIINDAAKVASLTSMGRDIAILKRAVNVEKKSVEALVDVPAAFAAKAGVLTGAYHLDIAPIVPQGVTAETRNGNSLKLTGCMVNMQIKQQSNTVNNVNYKWMIVKVLNNDADYSSADVLNNMWQNNPFSGVQDIYSSRKQASLKNFIIVKQGYKTMKGNTVTGGQGVQMIQQPLRLNLHQRYINDSATQTTRNALYLIILAGTGDASSGTGLVMEASFKYYYVDN